MAMGDAAREFVLKIVADVKDATKGIDSVEKSAGSFKDTMVNVGKTVATGVAVGAAVKFGKDAVNAAGDLDDAMDGIQLAFGDAGDSVVEFGKHAAETLGISQADYGKMATKTGQLLKGMGISAEDAAESTNTLSLRAADLATVFGTDVNTAMEAINGALKGTTKPLTQFGITMSKADIDSRAMAEGYVDASGKVTEAGRAIAAQELILEQSADSAGQFAKNSGDLGSQQAIMSAKFQDLSATIGTMLLPILQNLMDMVFPFLTFIQNNIGWIAPLIAGIAGIVLGIKAWTIAQAAYNLVMDANPIFQVIAAVTALTAAVIWAYQNVQWFRDAVDAVGDAFQWLWEMIKKVYNWIKENWPLLLGILTGPIGLAVVAIVKHWDAIKEGVKTAFNWIKDNWPKILAILTGPIGLAVLAIVSNWDKISALFNGFKDAVNRAFTGLIDVLQYPFKVASEFISRIWGDIKRLFDGIKNGINNAFKGLSDVITYPFKVAVDAIKNLWNSTIGGFGFSIPDIPGIPGRGKRIEIPRMATGGIVRRPTLALIGEAGPEAVVPLSGAGGFGNVTINVYALTANAEVGRKVYEALREYERTSGKAVA